MRCLLSSVLCILLLAGCASTTGKSSKDSPKKETADSKQAIQPSPLQAAGRVIAVDMRELTVIIEVPPYLTLPVDYSGRLLLSRSDDLTPTARLQASPYLRGRTLAARLLAGRPQIGDEVVFIPAGP